jgi:ABC-2 type transport system ATP-binding protein
MNSSETQSEFSGNLCKAVELIHSETEVIVGNILKVNNITKNYRGMIAVDNVSLSIGQGDILGIIGGNGCGKTTLLRLISGIIKPESGDVSYVDRSCKTGAMIDGPCVYNDMTAMENLRYYGRLFGVDNENRYNELLVELGIDTYKDKKAGKYSLGMKQRLGLAIALLDNIDLLILDEPFNGLDVRGMADLEQALFKINKEMGVTIIVTSHIISELVKVCNRYVIMDRGKICGEYSHLELIEKVGGIENIDRGWENLCRNL